MRIQRIEAGTAEENFTGSAPIIILSREWYGNAAYVCQRASDGRLFTVYPRGAMPDFLDALETDAQQLTA